MLHLYLQAPFAAFRTFTAGSFRPTAAFITPSAAYGLILNVAGIEMREISAKEPMTLIRRGLPRFRLAIGNVGGAPTQHILYQQLHNYPVGKSRETEARKEDTKGNKYNISPVRRAFLADVRAYLCVDGSTDIETRLRHGLSGKSPRSYGLPYLGDNSFLLDRLEPVHPGDIKPARWFVRIGEDEDGHWDSKVTRLTICIDRSKMSDTISDLFVMSEANTRIPDAAWVEVGY